MQIGEEGGNNPDLVDVTAHGPGALKSPMNPVQGIAREGNESNGESNALYPEVWKLARPQALFLG